MSPRFSCVLVFSTVLASGCDNPVDYRSDEGRFSIQFPAAPKVSHNASKDNAPPSQVVKVDSFRLGHFSVTYRTTPEGAQKVTAQQKLDAIKEHFFKELKGWTLVSDTTFDRGKCKARDLQFEDASGSGRVQIFGCDASVYIVAWGGSANATANPAVEKFFGSFQIDDSGSASSNDTAPVEEGETVAKGEPAPDIKPDESPMSWEIRSADDSSTLTETFLKASSKCSLECRVGSTISWTATTDCIGEKADRKFVSKDCKRTVVMIPAPPRGQMWRRVEVMRIYKRGELDYAVVGAAAMPDEIRLRAYRSWLKGCYEVPGEPPRYSADGDAVEYETIDDKKSQISLIADASTTQAIPSAQSSKTPRTSKKTSTKKRH